MKKMLLLLCSLVGLAAPPAEAEADSPPVRLAVIGLVHGHVGTFIPNALNNPAVQLVGIVEPDPKLAAHYAEMFQLSTNLFFTSLEALLAHTNVQAAALFTTTFDHRRVVEACAPRGVQVMMEKPLAVSLPDGLAMAAAAKKGGVNLIVNYETTWYPANATAYDLVCDKKAIGDVRKIVVHDGHRGPLAIGCPPEFVQWLTDPKLNGGGAIIDFGCYGADLLTWLMAGERPTSVFAVTQHFQPELYPQVDDEATIVLTYPKTQGIIQASWNWPIDRKDMEIYGQTGQLFVPRKNLLRVTKADQPEHETKVSALTGPQADPISYLAAVVRGEIRPAGLSSLAVNLTVMEILDAARASAATGKRVDLPAQAPFAP
ncbi:MAG: Gfo/Idh/MocA family oxidoreductase [Verrucomicrobiota bacterium]